MIIRVDGGARQISVEPRDFPRPTDLSQVLPSRNCSIRNSSPSASTNLSPLHHRSLVVIWQDVQEVCSDLSN